MNDGSAVVDIHTYTLPRKGSSLQIDNKDFKQIRRRQRERHKTIGFNEQNKGSGRQLFQFVQLVQYSRTIPEQNWYELCSN